MRLMTEEEQRKLLATLAHNWHAADFMTFDCVCYGGPLEQYRDAREYIDKCIKAVPADIRKQFDAEIRKAKANKLRAKADRIEAGKDDEEETRAPSA